MGVCSKCQRRGDVVAEVPGCYKCRVPTNSRFPSRHSGYPHWKQVFSKVHCLWAPRCTSFRRAVTHQFYLLPLPPPFFTFGLPKKKKKNKILSSNRCTPIQDVYFPFPCFNLNASFEIHNNKQSDLICPFFASKLLPFSHNIFLRYFF